MIGLSIIIPIYNGEKFVRKCIDSILGSKISDGFEIILVNDGSIDGTKQICLQLEQEFEMIKFIDLEENHGVSKARNCGIRAASGKYIYFLDVDDEMQNGALGCILNYCREDYDFVAFRVLSKKGDNIVKNKIDFVGEVNKKDLFECNLDLFFNVHFYIWVTNKIYKKSIIKDNNICFPEDVSFSEDFLFNLEFIKVSNSYFISDTVAFVYNRNVEGSLSRKNEKRNITEFIKQRKKLIEFFGVYDITQNPVFLKNTAGLLSYSLKKVLQNEMSSIEEKLLELKKLTDSCEIIKKLIPYFNLDDEDEGVVFNFIKSQKIDNLFKIGAVFQEQLTKNAIISRTPLRISLCGGGSDLRAYYSFKDGNVVSFAINKYTKIYYKSCDKIILVNQGKIEICENVNELENEYVREALKYFGINAGLIFVSSEKSSGLGGSSSFLVGLIKIISRLKNLDLSNYDIAKLACEIEINVIGKAIGKQDQFAVALGGLNHIIFKSDESVDVMNINLTEKNIEKLFSSLMLVKVGGSHDASKILTSQAENFKKCNTIVDQEMISDLAVKLSHELKSGNINCIGKFLDLNWNLKRRLADGITNATIDEVYSRGISAGATGGKLLGAGGAGFMLFFVPEENRARFLLDMYDMDIEKINIDREGTIILEENND